MLHISPDLPPWVVLHVTLTCVCAPHTHILCGQGLLGDRPTPSFQAPAPSPNISTEPSCCTKVLDKCSRKKTGQGITFQVSVTRETKGGHRAYDVPLPHMTLLLWMLTPQQNGDGRKSKE